MGEVGTECQNQFRQSFTMVRGSWLGQQSLAVSSSNAASGFSMAPRAVLPEPQGGMQGFSTKGSKGEEQTER